MNKHIFCVILIWEAELLLHLAPHKVGMKTNIFRIAAVEEILSINSISSPAAVQNVLIPILTLWGVKHGQSIVRQFISKIEHRMAFVLKAVLAIAVIICRLVFVSTCLHTHVISSIPLLCRPRRKTNWHCQFLLKLVTLSSPN